MIDRKSRDEMGKAIRNYMAETTGAFELADSLYSIAHDTQDGTVKFVEKVMWFHYDDCKDHKIVASKQEWDYFNRLLLLLESDAEAEFVRSRNSWRSEWRSIFRSEKPSAAEAAITPFPSISSLLSLRRSVKGFARTRYPSKIAGRRIRNILVEGILWIPQRILFPIFSPIVFLIRMLRRSQLVPRIKMPERGREIR